LQRKAVTPEEAGLCGCWQFIAVWRERQYLKRGQVVKTEEEYAFYVTSVEHAAYSAEALMEIIHGHWDAVENGSHHRRDVTLGEDASRIAKDEGRNGAQVMATLRNVTLGLFEWQKHRSEVQGFVPGWRRKMDGKQAVRLVKRTA
jgi:predicted transposase YbfD/YdcC